jgi:hypothetical protein
VKQRKHESANVSFCDPVQSTGYSKQTIKFYYFSIVPMHPRRQGEAFSAPAGEQTLDNQDTVPLQLTVQELVENKRTMYQTTG